MDLQLTDVQRDLRDTARAFIAREVMPLEAEVLRHERRGEKGIAPAELRELQARARRFGFWGIGTPARFGGADLPAVTQSLIWTEVGRTCVPFLFGGEADNILYKASSEQQREFLLPTIEGERTSCFAITEPEAGSDATAIRMRAVRDGDDWVLNGEKTFITKGVEADFAIVIAVTDADKGHRGGHTAFLVDRSMGWTADPIETMGPSTPAAMGFVDVRVPARNVLGEVGEGFSLAMEWIGRGRYVIPSRAIGACERLLAMAVEYANDRRTFGKAIGEHQMIQQQLADCELDLEQARWLVLVAAWTVEQGRDARHEAALSKLGGATAANRIVDRVMQIHGGMGYTAELPIERWYREARLWRIFEGTDEIQRRTIARDLLAGRRRIGGHLA
ncbi:acyl-CoA dehydrogenase family protein [Conexibacter sp. JD483]|uniref:acyl-CoA dehydrogenase family protein n=1 Tax=unclassified Conexibacter TaxID=2627773 RepID=UPI002717F108|nr:MULTISPECIES: acyl-CoA dehydrogenase family protein [unclassified Conexibacter]MDO8187380.1 acyl-CoA dehydrogenase family protein [Conexibacter sp. CPCC 205706]MDO8200975.1 acyl-CoA dehydrogenase family protein [Conexibacter sp. CPCC 205762]MDR9371403.1 acyl-CoA dehydrogenase family protein [Conexibacter sp. JD483]